MPALLADFDPRSAALDTVLLSPPAATVTQQARRALTARLFAPTRAHLDGSLFDDAAARTMR